MISKLNHEDIEQIMSIWLNENIFAHDFIDKKYWHDNYDNVKKAIFSSEIYVYNVEKEIIGFIGINNGFIAGLFVKEEHKSKGIGKELIDFVKVKYKKLFLNVYMKNQRAVNFYEKQGFVKNNERIDLDTGEKEYEMIFKS